MKQILVHLLSIFAFAAACLTGAEPANSGGSVGQLKSRRFAKRSEPPAKPKTTIVLDAGHGGDDYGTHSLGKHKYHEKYLNLSTTNIVRAYLQNFGYNVLMTRTDDTFVSLPDRAEFANKHAPQLFVSIHYNSAPSPDADGIEVFFFRTDSNKTRTLHSKQLAQAILDKTLKHTNARSRGVKHGNYAVLRETTMPAALIEGGFLTNTEEMEKIKNPDYMKKLALGIAQGIDSYFAKEKILSEK
jgi:N-acetylmuramoyl-L-alanine amidase